MKKCVPSAFDRIITILAALGCAVIAFFAFRQFLLEDRTPIMFCVVLLFVGAAVYSLGSLWLAGNWGFFYNEEKIVFVLLRNDRREFRWEDLPWAIENKKISICRQSSPEVWYFYFPGEKKKRQLTVLPRMTGYEELIAMLRKKNVPAQEPGESFVFNKEQANEIFCQAFGRPLYEKDQRQKGKKS